MRRMVRFLRCMWSHWWMVPASLGVLVFLVWSVWSTVALLEEKDQRLTAGTAGREYLCEKVNELPTKINRLLVLSEQRRRFTGPTTTIPVPPDLTPAERAQLAAINAEIAALTADLGDPIDCGIVSTGSTTTSRPGARR